MHHIYACGFNGFQQIQEIESSLKSFIDVCSKLLNNKHDKPSKNEQAKMESEGTSPQETLLESKVNRIMSAEKNRRKRKMKEPHHDGDTPLCSNAVDIVKKELFQDQVSSNAAFLRNIFTFPENVLEVEHAEMPWSRIGITLSISSGDCHYYY